MTHLREPAHELPIGWCGHRARPTIRTFSVFMKRQCHLHNNSEAKAGPEAETVRALCFVRYLLLTYKSFKYLSEMSLTKSIRIGGDAMQCADNHGNSFIMDTASTLLGRRVSWSKSASDQCACCAPWHLRVPSIAAPMLGVLLHSDA